MIKSSDSDVIMLGQKMLWSLLVMAELCLTSVNSKQFQDVIFTKQSDHSIQHMAFDPGSKSFYIGATNALYRLNDSYHEIESVGEFPCFVKDLGASCIETKPSNKNYNQLLLVTNNYILTCGTHYLGLCEKRNLTNISSILTSEDQIEKNKYFISSSTPLAFLVGLSTVVKNKRDNKSQEILLFGKKFSNAATEANKYYPIFARTVDQLMAEDVSNTEKSMIKAFTLMIDNNKKESYPIQFISAMETDNFIYFLTIQNSSSKIVKFCKIYDNDQDTVQTYEDLALECDVDSERFTKIKDGTFVKTTNNEFVLVTTFSTSSKAAVCVWSEKEIQQELKKSRVYRCSGNNVTEKALRQKPQFDLDCPKLDLTSPIDITVVGFCSSSTLSYLSLIIGITPAMENSSYDIDDDSLTKVVGTTINKQSIVYVGTTSGKVKSLYMEPNTFKLTELRTYDIGNQAIIGLKIFDEKVYVVTESKIVQLTEPTCSDYKNCSDCMSAKSVQCGWCIESQKCTMAGSENCQFYENSSYWLPSVRGSCLAISYTRGFGGRPYDDGLSILPIKLTLSPKLTPLSGINFTCQMVFKGSVENDAVFNSDNCSFTNLPKTVGMRHLNLLLNGKIIASTTYFVYDCTVYKSCGTCTMTPQTDCFWCIETANCEKNAGNCGIGKPNARTNTDNCPQIKQQKDSRLQNGRSKDIIFTGSNLPSGANIEYKCKIDGTTFEGNRTSETELSCRNVLISYQENNGSVSKGVEFKYGPSTGLVTLESFDGQIFVEVYKCSLLPMPLAKTDCSYCNFLNQTLGYECGFCNNKCSDTQSCPVSDKCGIPQVSKVDPVRGPVGGGTLVSIFGINLGVKTQDVSNITLAGVNCINVSITYEGLNQRLTCTSASSGEEMKGPVSVIVNGQSSQTANVEFAYKVPVIESVKPNRIIQSGGAKITIYGQNFAIGNGRRVTLRDELNNSKSSCKIQNTEDRSIICEVGASAEKNRFPRRQDIVLTIDEKTTKTLQGQFYYLPNPIITGTIPEKLISIYSGGLRFIITGTNFSPTIQKMRLEYESVSSECFYENENETRCYFPPFQQNRRQRRSTNQPVTVVMDGFSHPLSSSIEYVNDPIVYVVNGNKTFEYDPDTQDRLLIKGMYLRLAATEKDYKVLIGSGICDFIKVNENNISCIPPSKAPAPKGDDKSIFLRVEIGIKYAVTVGKLEYSGETPTLQIIIGVLVTCLFIIAIVAGVIFFRVKAKNKKEIDNLILQMTTIEEQAKQDGQEEFAEMQLNITDIKRDVVSSGTPYYNYEKFVLHVLFPKDIDSTSVTSLLEDIEEPNKNKQKAMENFERLLNNKFFLKSLISTLDKQRKLTMQDKAQFSSMLSVVMLGKMRDFFEVVNCLLSKLVDTTSKRQHKTLFNRFESITLRLLSNWIFIALYPYLKDGGGSQLFMLYKAVQTVIESRPVDDVTGDAKNTLSEDHFLREKVEYNKLKLEIDLNGNGSIYPCEVLDCDTISQVKHKCLYQIYKNKLASDMPSVEDVELEWHEGKSGRLQLNDIDPTNETKDGVLKLNTLHHYNVRDGSHMALLYKYSPDEHDEDDPYMNFKASPAEVFVRMPSVSEEKNTDNKKKFHLVYEVDEEENGGSKKKEVSKMVLKDKGVHITNLMNTKLILQDYIKAVFDNVLDTDKIPTVVHYLFGVLESLANKNSVEQDTLLCWKSESYAIRIWALLIARPESLFDISKAKHVEPCLDVIKQVFIDCFHKTTVSKESSLQKLLFASEVPYYQKKVMEFYKSLSGIDTVTDQAFWNEMNRISQMQQRTLSFKKPVALQRLFKFITQYEDDIFTDLNEGDETKDLEFGKKLDEVFKLMHQDE